MKLVKDHTGSYNYITEDRKFLVTHGYPALNAMKCWIVYESGEKTRYLKTFK